MEILHELLMVLSTNEETCSHITCTHFYPTFVLKYQLVNRLNTVNIINGGSTIENIV